MHSANTLELVHNTVVMTFPGGSFIATHGAMQSLKLTANIFAGTGSPRLTTGGFPSGSVVQQNNVGTDAGNFSAADNIAVPNFWPGPALRAQLGLAGSLDPGYVSDTPAPFLLRPLSAPKRVVGAIQSQP